MDFTIVDGGVAVVAAVSGLLAYSRGLTREVFAIFGWVAAAALAFFLAPVVEPLVREAPVIGPYIASSCVISMIVAFTVVMAIGLLFLSVFTPLASSVVLSSILGPIDRVLGFLFGVARGFALAAIAYILYVNLSGGVEYPPLDNAFSKVFFEDAAQMISTHMPDRMPDGLSQRVDALMAPCGAELPGGGGTAPAPATGTAS